MTSAVVIRGLCADVLNLVLADYELVVGEMVLGELRRALIGKFGVPGKTMDEVVVLLRQKGIVVKRAEAFPVKIRDEDDLAVLSEAIAGNAKALVTGDRDLLDIIDEPPPQILSPRGFWEQLREDKAPPNY